jgi:CRP/FNR family transcriptional regulator
MTRVNGVECEICRAKGACFFTDLKDESLKEFRDGRITNVYKKRQVVFYEGHRPHGVFLVCSGRVKVYKSDHKGHQLTVRVANHGDILGYRALLASEPYSATAEALDDSTLAYIDESRFKAILARHQILALRMLTQLAKDVRGAEDKARDMAMKSSRERLAELILMLKATRLPGDKPERNGATMRVPYTRQDLAELAGLAQETVIRLLTELEEQKVIAINGRQLTILNEPALEKQAGVLA